MIKPEMNNSQILQTIINISSIPHNIEQILIKAKEKLELGTFKYEYSETYDEFIYATEYKGEFIGDAYKLRIVFYEHFSSHIHIEIFKHESLVFSYLETESISGGRGDDLLCKEITMHYLKECKDIKDAKKLNNILNIVRNVKN